MSRRKRKAVGWILALLALIGSPSLGRTDPPASKSRVEAALQNIITGCQN
jgi:hypothetical protein